MPRYSALDTIPYGAEQPTKPHGFMWYAEVLIFGALALVFFGFAFIVIVALLVTSPLFGLLFVFALAALAVLWLHRRS